MGKDQLSNRSQKKRRTVSEIEKVFDQSEITEDMKGNLNL